MFHSARLKLTAWYLLIICCIGIFFSVLVYRVLTLEMDRFVEMQKVRIERRMEDFEMVPRAGRALSPSLQILADPDLVSEVKLRIALSLVGVNGVILILAGAFGYVLAGQTLKPIQEMVDEQSRFVSDASHELRTPLTALTTALEVHVRDPHLTIAEAKSVMRKSVEQVQKLKNLSDALLALADKDQSSGPSVSEEAPPSEVRSVIEGVVESLAPLAHAKHIHFTTTIPEPITVGLGADVVQRVVTILSENAIKYSPEHTEVAVRATVVGSSCHISVEDHGIGIDAADMPHLFERFYRADSARCKTTNEGFGLGLAIAQKIVTAAKGKLTVSSTSGSGSTFTVKLPLA